MDSNLKKTYQQVFKAEAVWANMAGNSIAVALNQFKITVPANTISIDLQASLIEPGTSIITAQVSVLGVVFFFPHEVLTEIVATDYKKRLKKMMSLGGTTIKNAGGTASYFVTDTLSWVVQDIGELTLKDSGNGASLTILWTMPKMYYPQGISAS